MTSENRSNMTSCSNKSMSFSIPSCKSTFFFKEKQRKMAKLVPSLVSFLIGFFQREGGGGGALARVNTIMGSQFNVRSIPERYI